MALTSASNGLNNRKALKRTSAFMFIYSPLGMVPARGPISRCDFTQARVLVGHLVPPWMFSSIASWFILFFAFGVNGADPGRRVIRLDGFWQIAEGKVDQVPATFDHKVR